MYIDNNSLAMGNLLSSLAAEIFLDNLENDIQKSNNDIQKHPLFNKFIFWDRYDDILACFKGTRRQLQTFFNHINKLHPNVTFTKEIEDNNSINFFDLTVTKTQNKLSFSIFHKLIYTNMVIHNSSLHPHSHKLASFRCYIHRLPRCLIAIIPQYLIL